MKTLEKEYLDLAIYYKALYDNTSWWKFKLRAKLLRNRDTSLELMIKHSKPNKK
jgi:hypothetical protein